MADTPGFPRLTPLAEITAWIAGLAPVDIQWRAPGAAIGWVLAAPPTAPADLPPAARALWPGIATPAAACLGATPYDPLPLPASARMIDAGATLPPDCDAVLAEVTVNPRTGGFEATESPPPGAGVLGIGADLRAGPVPLAPGLRLTARHAALLTAAGIDLIAVRRPRLAVITRDTTGAAELLAALVTGVESRCVRVAAPADLLPALRAAQADADLAVLIGGPFVAGDDPLIAALAAEPAGEIIAHGLALAPGHSTALARLGPLPVLLPPAAPADLLAVGLALLRPLCAVRAGATPPPAHMVPPLRGKIAARVGLSELVLLAADPKREDTQVLAVGEAPLAAQLAASHWCLISPASEGVAVGGILAALPLDPP